MNQFPYRASGADANFTGIPSLIEWQGLTTVYSMWGMHKDKRENLLLLSIDSAITEYHNFVETPFDLQSQLESEESKTYYKRATALLLIGITKNCQRWLESKSSSRSSKRRPTISNLWTEAMMCITRLRLNYALNTPGGLYRPNNRTTDLGSMAATIRWQMLNESITKLGFAHSAKVLHDHYWLENNEALNPGHLQGGGVRDGWNASGDKFAFSHIRKTAAKGSEVKYASPAERWQFEVIIKQDDCGTRLYRRTSAASQEMTLMSRGGLFIIDNNRKLYCSMGIEFDNKLFHHSTMMAGTGVQFAGSIFVEEGKITEIDNASGHYRPEIRHSLTALLILKMKHIPLEKITLLIMDGFREQEGIRGEIHKIPIFKIYNNALEFHTSRGECPPSRTT